MVTKGIVEQVLKNNTVRVRLPVYDRPVIANVYNSLNDLSIASICTLPNTRLNLQKGDIVFVTFEDNDFAKPVILGCLYSEYMSKSLPEITLNSLAVSVNTHLSSDTYIGNVLPQDIENLTGTSGNLQAQINLLVNIASELDNRVYDLEHPTYKASVRGLGAQDPTTVIFTKDDGFPTSFEEWTDENSNVFVKIPTMYRTIDNITDGQITAFTISTRPINSNSQPYNVFVKPNGEVMPYVCIGKYCGSNNTKLESKELTNTTMEQSVGRTSARANGVGYQLYDWQFHKLFTDIALIVGQNVNFQDGTSTIDNYLGVDNLSTFNCIDGFAIIYSSEYYWCACANPELYTDTPDINSEGYVCLSYAIPGSTIAEIKKLGYDSAIPFANFPTEVVNNSTMDTYYCDRFMKSANYTLYRSAIGAAYSYAGLFALIVNLNATNACARLCYRPLSETIIPR